MKTYNVQKRVETEKNTDLFDQVGFDTLEEAEKLFGELLKKKVNLAGEYNENNHKEYYIESLEIESYDEETDEFEIVEGKIVYSEGMKDKNNYKGDYASFFWYFAKFDGTELVYNFYYDGNLEYENVKESELTNWYNY
ncbi:hypothetical protein V3Q77_08265 [Flavobacterium davisii]|uniref:DUF4178 domain-containing protein n=1 Tax=Flavobacterium davisii TaxID=2906077 RepID=A0ABW8PQJ2_9FLAO